jgi:CRISPR-associated protein Cas5d
VSDPNSISNKKSHVKVKVGGDFACFSRPEFKVERVTYPVMTPSAARGLLEAIFWRPEFRYEIREIHVLRPIREFALMRNEISDRQGSTPIVVEEKRQQRTSLILRDVEYLVFADMVLREYVTNHLAKYLSQFERRVEKGRCYMTPYLGAREFAAWFEKPSGDETPISENRNIGTMLFDLVFKEDPARKEVEFLKRDRDGKVRCAWGHAEALFFDATLEDGILKVPREKYAELYELEGEHA